MSPHVGRPKTELPKRNDIKVRLDDDTTAKLDEYCAKNNMKRAAAIRKGIDLLLGKK